MRKHSAIRAGADFRPLAAIGLSVLGLWGCAVGPNYKRPALDVPQQFRGPAPLVSTNSMAELPWWDIFKDEDLRDVIREALTNNYDVRIAVARVEQARAIAAQNRAAFFPQLNYAGAASRGKNALGSSQFYNGGQTLDLFEVSASASWEVDLWGRLRRLNEAARAQYLASEEARRDLMISMISQAAQEYIKLLALDQQLAVAKRSTNSFGESLRIFRQRLEQGVISKLETSAAEAALASAAAGVPALEQQILVQENALSVLLGRNPGPIRRNDALLNQSLGMEVPAGLPSELIQRRPDIRESEQSLRAANAQLGVAVANFFPHLNLTGLFGQVSPELTAFTSGAANAWSVGANLAGPLFQGGRLRAEYQQAKAAREQATLRYQAAVLNAFQEVSNDLNSVQRFGEQRVQQAQAVKAYQVAVQVSMERYVAGKASYYEVLQEQQLLFPAENALVQAELNQFTAFIQLYRDLGGGFGPQAPAK